MRGQFGGGMPAQNSERTRLLVLAGFFFVLLCATVGAVFFYTATASKATVKTVVVEKEPEVRMADVLVPVKNIEPGQTLEPAMFRRDQRPAIGLPSRVVRDFEEIKGQYARSLIVADQPLHRDYITGVRPTSALSVKIPDGYRAVTISVDVRSSVEGWARAGSRVDVVWTSRVRGQAAVTVIVQNAQIISAERQTDSAQVAAQNGAPVPSTVTLLVTAGDAAKIQLAQSTGSLSLVLRGDQDPGKPDTNPSTTTTLEDLYPRTDNAAPAARNCPKVRMRNAAGEMEEYCFENGELKPLQGGAATASGR